MARLTSPSGATVNVSDDKVAELTRRGFTSAEPSNKTPAKKAAAPRKSASSDDK